MFFICRLTPKGFAAMGKVMELADAQLGGTAEGKTISSIVKKLLT